MSNADEIVAAATARGYYTPQEALQIQSTNTAAHPAGRAMFANLRRMGAERAFAQVRIDLDALQRSVSFLLGAAMPDSGAFEELLDYEAYVQLITEINALSNGLQQKLMANVCASSTEEPAAAAAAASAVQPVEQNTSSNLSSAQIDVAQGSTVAAQTGAAMTSVVNAEEPDARHNVVHEPATLETQIDASLAPPAKETENTLLKQTAADSLTGTDNGSESAGTGLAVSSSITAGQDLSTTQVHVDTCCSLR